MPAEVALGRAVTGGVPADALAIYGRWWQLETWLRLLVSLELRAHYGHDWLNRISNRAVDRATRDEINRYMASPDAEDPLTYLDTGELFALIDSDDLWQLFEAGLLPRVRWRGAADMLSAIRRRSAHCRRPHGDDLPRLEQMLRDLEPGARVALGAFAEQHRVWRITGDPVVQAWVGGADSGAAQLIDSALREHRIEFELRWSQRPWAAGGSTDVLSGRQGFLWHAEWRGRVAFDVRRFWRDRGLDTDDHRAAIVRVVQKRSTDLSVIFACVDGADRVAPAIGACFSAVLQAVVQSTDATRAARSAISDLDSRIHTAGPLVSAGLDESIPIFFAHEMV